MDHLICNTVTEGCWVPANQRTCTTCDVAVWVSADMTPVVDSGKVTPLCGACWNATPDSDSVYALHPSQMRQLAEAGILDFAHQFVTAINTLRERPMKHDRNTTP